MCSFSLIIKRIPIKAIKIVLVCGNWWQTAEGQHQVVGNGFLKLFLGVYLVQTFWRGPTKQGTH